MSTPSPSSDARPQVLFLDLPPPPSGPDAGAARAPGGGWDLLALAQALDASPIWPKFQTARFVLRQSGAGDMTGGRLAVAGRFTEADLARLTNLQRRLSCDLPRLHHVSYAAAEDCAQLLADKLRAQFGPEDCARFHYTAIPRGGHIVLGLLAYALGLRGAQLCAPADPQIPHVIVDDCCLSGARLRETLPQVTGDALVIAMLHAPPELRAAVVAQEPRVQAFLSAQDLVDDAPARFGADYDAWLADQRRLRALRGYWYGDYAPLSYAWNEPDVGFHNPVTDRHEVTWRLLGPAQCLKNRPRQPARITVNTDPPGPLCAAPDVVWADFGPDPGAGLGDCVLIGDAGRGQSHQLDGVGADIWRALMATGAQAGALAQLAAQYDAPPDALARDVAGFIEMLITAGVLQPLPGEPV